MLTASKEAIDSLVEDIEYLWFPDSDIVVYDTPPTALHFLREHVAKSRPCIVRRALPTMTWKEIRTIWPESLPLHVDVTPDGHGDCLRRVHTTTTPAGEGTGTTTETTTSERYFVKPMECEMTMSEFCQALEMGQRSDGKGIRTHTPPIEERIFERSSNDDDSSSSSSKSSSKPSFENAVFYYSRQNDCLRTELQPLWDKLPFPSSLEWAAEAFGNADDGGLPDAVNLWIGPERAVSAMHKDPYENLFHVLHGTKIFTLVPPACAPLLQERPVQSGRFVWKEGGDGEYSGWQVRADVTDDGAPGTVPWITVDATQRRSQHPADHHDTPSIPYRQVRVGAGEMLYLPALWFHRVAQESDDVTIGLNYWYDMKFESPLWVYFHFVQQMQLTKKSIEDKKAKESERRTN